MIGGTAATRTAFLTLLVPVPTDVSGDLAAAGGVADQDRIPQVQRFDDGREIVGIAVHVVVRRWLA